MAGFSAVLIRYELLICQKRIFVIYKSLAKKLYKIFNIKFYKILPQERDDVQKYQKNKRGIDLSQQQLVSQVDLQRRILQRYICACLKIIKISIFQLNIVFLSILPEINSC